jgi:hypothetical protein
MAGVEFLSARELLDQVLGMIRSFTEDRTKLEKLYGYISDELYQSRKEDTADIPERFRSVVTEAADRLSAGMICFINADTLQLASFIREELEGGWDDEEDAQDQLGWLYKEWEHIIQVEPPGSPLSYSFMERFTETAQDSKAKDALQKALGSRGPFRHFNAVMHTSPLKNDWFDFRQKCLEAYVFEAVLEQLPPAAG